MAGFIVPENLTRHKQLWRNEGGGMVEPGLRVSVGDGFCDHQVKDCVPEELQALVARRPGFVPGGMGAGILEQLPVLEGVPEKVLQLPVPKFTHLSRAQL